MKEFRRPGSRPGNTEDRSARMQIDADAVRELSALLDETGLTEIEVEENGRRIRVSRQQTALPLAPAATASSPVPPSPTAAAGQAIDSAAPKKQSSGTIPSPMVGTVFVAPEPGKPPFVQIGDSVREGDTLLIVEAMKTMNPIIAPFAGVVKEICVADAQPVEFGQSLMVLGPAG